MEVNDLISRDAYVFPLSYAQQRLWFIDQLMPEVAAYNISEIVEFRKELDVGALKRSLGELVRRHETLRTTFAAVQGEPFQVIAPSLELELSVEDLSEVVPEEREAEAARLASEEAQETFDLSRGPLLRARLIRMEAERHLLLLTMHHIISDGWSVEVMLGELRVLYEVFTKGQSSPLPELQIQYADFAVWQREWLQDRVQETQLKYWRQQLKGMPPLLELSSDRGRPAVPTFRGHYQWFELSGEVSQALKDLSQQQGVTLFMTLLAAFKTLLSRYTNQTDLVVGTPIANRNRTELEPLIGFFVNTLVLRTDLSGDPSFLELLQRVREVCLGAYAHQDVPFEKLVHELQPDRNLNHNPLVQVLFDLQHARSRPTADASCDEFSNFIPSTVGVNSSLTKFDLTLSIEDTDRGVTGVFEHSTDLFDDETITRMMGHFQVLLGAIVKDPQQRISRHPMLSAEDREQLLFQFNDTNVDYQVEDCLHLMFERQVKLSPEAIAVVHDEGHLSYEELDNRANQIAHYLRRLGIGPESLVGVMLPRSPETVAVLLGIMKAGGAYVPLDAEYPRERLRWIIEDADMSLLLTQSYLKDRVGLNEKRVHCLDLEAPALNVESTQSPAVNIRTENLAYVIYTSGSTGRPKGVAIEHRSAVTFLHWCKDFFSAEELSSVLASTSLCFDLSIFELFAPLTTGGSLVLVENVLQLADSQKEVSPVLINTVPSAIGELLRLKAVPSSVRTINLAGEALKRPLVEQIYKETSVRRVVNLYGPSEDTTYSTCEEVARGANEIVAIGRPIANTQAYVLNEGLEPVPIGVPGHLYLSGAGLARGYLNRPDLTADKFVPNPFSLQPGALIYGTGDLARYLPDGRIDFLGRIDTQVKIRGYRVELGEIEAFLLHHDGLRDAIVSLRDDHGFKRLVAYVVADDRSSPPSVSDLRNHLEQNLPGYMIPGAFVFLEQLPLTPNGKIDRRALPEPEITRPELTVQFLAPQSDVEKRLAEIWSEVLGVTRVGRDDDFFELGGHSLLATQIVSRVREAFHVELPLRSIFEASTLARLTRYLKEHGGLEVPVNAVVHRARQDDRTPLSYAQQRLWFIDQLMPEVAAYNISEIVEFRKELDVGALKRSLGELVRRHETLRTTFAAVQGEPFQVIAPSLELELSVEDLSEVVPEEREAEAARLASEEAQETFDLSRGPLLRARLIRMEAERHLLLLTMHHIISDGWSVEVMLGELRVLYEAFTKGQSSPLPELQIQYADFAVWQREWLQDRVQETQLKYWRQQLKGMPPLLELSSDRGRPAVPTFRGHYQWFELSGEVSQALKDLSQQQGVTLFMTLLAAFKTLLSRYTNQTDLVVGTPIANRNRTELEPLIGFFVNTLVLRTDLSGDPSFLELLQRVREVCLGAYAHQDVPFEKLVHELQPDRNLSFAPFFQIMFQLDHTELSEDSNDESPFDLAHTPIDSQVSEFDITVTILEEPGRTLRVELQYSTDLFDETTIVGLLRSFECLLDAVVANPQLAISELPLLRKEERQALVQLGLNRTAFEEDPCLHELVETSAYEDPDAIAVIYGEERLTYQQLNSRANQLASYLQALGVGPNVVVGVCMGRSLEIIVAILGVLKAGGAYLPIDPDYPQNRLLFMLSDADVRILLTHRDLLAKLRDHGAQTICLDDIITRSGNFQNPIRSVRPRDVAYVIYTSGSSGNPKGVMISHRAICNRLLWEQEVFPLTTSDAVLQRASFSFDASVWEIFAPLSMGARLVIATAGNYNDSAYLVRLISKHQITCISMIPSLLELLLDEGLGTCDSLKHVFCGVEPMTFALQERFFASVSASLHNLYGPTEASIDATYWTCDPDSRRQSIPIGKPIANTEIYLLDAKQEPVPIGVPAEMYIGGAGLSYGYIHRPDLTAERFIPHPFSTNPGNRLYRTGDLARYLNDGAIEYLGRTDQQVKIRGFRVELAEIETILRQHPSVLEAACAVLDGGVSGKRLIAYVVSANESSALTVSELRSYLKKQLPDYMIPGGFVFLEALPLTPNGKLDRRALPEPGATRPELGEAFVPPRGDLELQLADIWARLLELDQVGRDDNFFELGGHSLLATQIISRICETFHIKLPLRSIFESPTVARLATIISDYAERSEIQSTSELMPLPRAERSVKISSRGVLAFSDVAKHLAATEGLGV